MPDDPTTPLPSSNPFDLDPASEVGGKHPDGLLFQRPQFAPRSFKYKNPLQAYIDEITADLEKTPSGTRLHPNLIERI